MDTHRSAAGARAPPTSVGFLVGFLVAMAARHVRVEEAERLHEGERGGRSDEGEPPPLELLRERDRPR
jgi:hypothetical protein